MKRLFLYGTQGCHLCEQALEILAYWLDEAEYVIEEIDISEDDVLLDHYSLRIPVLKLEGSKKELDWPFDEQDLEAFLS